MKETHIYCLYGEPLYDMVIYLAMLLERLGEEVLVVDGSADLHTLSCVKSYGWGDIVNYRHVDFCKEDVISSLQKEAYTILLWIDAGETIRDRKGTYVFTDFSREHLEEAAIRIKDSSDRVSLILRDISNDKLGIEYLKSLLMEKEKNIRKVWKLQLDYGDFDNRIRLDHEPLMNFKHLSKEMLECLLAILLDISAKPEREIWKAIRKKETYGG